MYLQKVLEESEEIKEWRRKIKLAHLNKERSVQIQEGQTRKLHDLIRDAEEDEDVLAKLEKEQIVVHKTQGAHKLKNFHNKYVIQQQMKDRANQRAEAKYEYERDKNQVDDIIKKIQFEDLKAQQNEHKKKELAKYYMEEAYKEKSERRRIEKINEEQEKIREREYFEQVAKRESELKEKKAAIQGEKERIFQKISEEKKRQQAEKDYWEYVRNELYVEDNDRKMKIKELEEKEKKIIQKEEMLVSAIAQAQYKEEKKRQQLEEEKEFKRKLLEKFKEDERLEQYNIQRRKQKEFEYKKEIEKQWVLKLEQYKVQKEYELNLLRSQQSEEKRKREMVEYEKMKLIKENEDILKNYLSKDYVKLKK